MIQFTTIYILSSIILFFLGYFSYELFNDRPYMNINAILVKGIEGKPIFHWNGKMDVTINAKEIHEA